MHMAWRSRSGVRNLMKNLLNRSRLIQVITTGHPTHCSTVYVFIILWITFPFSWCFSFFRFLYKRMPTIIPKLNKMIIIKVTNMDRDRECSMMVDSFVPECFIFGYVEVLPWNIKKEIINQMRLMFVTWKYSSKI